MSELETKAKALYKDGDYETLVETMSAEIEKERKAEYFYWRGLALYVACGMGFCVIIFGLLRLRPAISCL